MEFIKKHWVKIIIALLIIFGMNKCTVACNRDTMINKQATEIVYKDSVIKAQSDSLNILKIRWDDAQNSKSDLKDVALGNKQELESQVRQLTVEKNELSNKVNSLTSENNKLKRDLNQLKQQINNK